MSTVVAKATSQTIGTTETEVLVVTNRNYRVINLSIANTGGTALNSFAIQGQVGGEDSWHNIANQSSDFSEYDVDPTTMAGSSSGVYPVDPQGYTAVRAIATVDSGSTTITAFAGAASHFR
ncbi:MAG: hypothetical protein AAFX78_04950 [Cyanobacteria bacterium J06638_20]